MKMRKILSVIISGVLAVGSMTVYASEKAAISMLSSAIVSAGSSVVVSGLILSPILLPASLVIKSVDYSKADKTATLVTETPDKKTVALKLSDKMAADAHLKAGDRVNLEKAPHGEGALLTKEGKVIAHMRNVSDEGLSGSAPLTGKP